MFYNGFNNCKIKYRFFGKIALVDGISGVTVINLLLTTLYMWATLCCCLFPYCGVCPSYCRCPCFCYCPCCFCLPISCRYLIVAWIPTTYYGSPTVPDVHAIVCNLSVSSDLLLWSTILILMFFLTLAQAIFIYCPICC
jgi:hypothetical protein